MRNFFENNQRLKPVAITAVIYLLIGGFIYSVLAGDSQVKILEKEVRVADDDAEVHPARTYLRIDDGQQIIAYYARLDTSYTLTRLLDYHRTNSGFTYSQMGYTYGIGLDDINGQKAPEGYKWHIYDDNEDVTYTLRDVKLENNHQYLIKLELVE